MIRVRIGEPYFYIDKDMTVKSNYDRREVSDDTLFARGNYFSTEEEALLYKEKVKTLLRERKK